MPCYKCSNGKYRYGNRGRCQFDTLAACRAAEAAVHARKPKKDMTDSNSTTKGDCGSCGGCQHCDCRDDCKNKS